MNSNDNREEALFEHCLGLPPEEREGYLRKQCPDEPELVESVMALLDSHDSAGEFLEELPTQDSYEVASRLGRIAPTEERPGDRIGPYQLLELIGEGAWGTVWIARQTSVFDRQVAIKILKVGMDTKDFLARFEAERQMLAMMDHPNIAKVLDVGSTERGRPYLVMELVKGVQILEFADKNRLGIRERVELFTKVCRALHHAHRKGVVHRDLKPSNILVSAQYDEALPKVIDFGVAKSNQFRGSGGELYTSMHTFIGTPVYSSPEQLEFTGRDVDARSDIYSLGALLYELLCGATPFDGDTANQKGMVEFVRQVREEDPPRPSQRFAGLSDDVKERVAAKRGLSPGKLESLLKGDLDWVALKCLEKDPSRRYDSAKDLADDLQAFLDDQTVTASSPSPWRKLKKTISGKRPAYAAWVEMGAVVAACIVVAFYFGSKQRSLSESSQLEISPDSSIQLTDKSLAVLPLENLSPDVENAYFTGAIHSEFVDQLDKIGDLRVIDRTSVRRYQNTTKPSSSIGEELGAKYLLEGSVYREGRKVAISLALIDASAERRLWSRTYERSTEDLFSLRSVVALDVARELQAFLSPDEIELVGEFPTKSREAYDAYLKSREYWGSGEEIPYLKRALEIDSDFYEAWAALAWRGLFRFSGPSRGDPELLAMAKEAIDNMVRLKPTYYLTFNLQAAYEVHANHDLEAALAFRLKDKAAGGGVRDIGWSYLQLGRLEPARQIMEEDLIQNDPLNPAANSRLYAVYTCLGMWKEAEVHLKNHLRALARLPKGVDGEPYPRMRFERYLAQLDFLLHGNLEKLEEGFRALPETLDTPMGKLWSDLVSRNFTGTLKQLEEITFDPENPFPVFKAGQGAPGIELIVSSQLNNSLDLEPFSLISALVHHAAGDNQASLLKVAEAKSYWEEAVASYHKIDPNHLAFLAICHALEGDREKMEATIPRIRELTETVNWQFRAEAKCEMKLAIAYLVLGDEDKALDQLEYANGLHSPMFVGREMELWFMFDKLKGNPRYEALVGNGSSSNNSNRQLNTELEIVPPPDEKSIAILPFSNISGREEDEPYATGLHSTLWNEVSQISDLKSTSLTSVMTYKGVNMRLTEIASELNVAKVLAGDVQIIGENMRVNVRLIDGATDTRVWGEVYDSPFTAEEYFTIQSEITKTIADALNAVLTPQERNRLDVPSTRNTEALQAFLEAREIVDSANQTRRDESIALLKKAIELDPEYIDAHIYLAKAHLVGLPAVQRYPDWRIDTSNRADAAINTALALDDSLSESHLVKGRIHTTRYLNEYYSSGNRVRNIEELNLAKESFDRALELDPDNAAVYVAYGRLAEAEAESNRSGPSEFGSRSLAVDWYRKAVELDPRNVRAKFGLATNLEEIGHEDEAEKQLRELLHINPNFPEGLRRLGIILWTSGKCDEAIAIARRSILVDPERIDHHYLLIHCYMALGNYGEALRWIQGGPGSGRGRSSELAGKALYLAFRAMERGDSDERDRQLGVAVREQPHYYYSRRQLLDADIRAGRFDVALMRYRSLFPFFFEEEFVIDGRKPTTTEGTFLSENFQAQAAMELAEILMHLGDRDRAEYLLDLGWEHYRANFPDRDRWAFGYGRGYGVRDAIRYALRGEKEAAMSAIREAVDGGLRDRMELEASHFDSIREEPEFKAAMAIVEADLARQLANVRRMEANGELAPIPDDPRYELNTPAKVLSEN